MGIPSLHLSAQLGKIVTGRWVAKGMIAPDHAGGVPPENWTVSS